MWNNILPKAFQIGHASDSGHHDELQMYTPTNSKAIEIPNQSNPCCTQDIIFNYIQNEDQSKQLACQTLMEHGKKNLETIRVQATYQMDESVHNCHEKYKAQWKTCRDKSNLEVSRLRNELLEHLYQHQMVIAMHQTENQQLQNEIASLKGELAIKDSTIVNLQQKCNILQKVQRIYMSSLLKSRPVGDPSVMQVLYKGQTVFQIKGLIRDLTQCCDQDPEMMRLLDSNGLTNEAFADFLEKKQCVLFQFEITLQHILGKQLCSQLMNESSNLLVESVDEVAQALFVAEQLTIWLSGYMVKDTDLRILAEQMLLSLPDKECSKCLNFAFQLAGGQVTFLSLGNDGSVIVRQATQAPDAGQIDLVLLVMRSSADRASLGEQEKRITEVASTCGNYSIIQIKAGSGTPSQSVNNSQRSTLDISPISVFQLKLKYPKVDAAYVHLEMSPAADKVGKVLKGNDKNRSQLSNLTKVLNQLRSSGISWRLARVMVQNMSLMEDLRKNSYHYV